MHNPSKSYGGINCWTIVITDRGAGYTLSKEYKINIPGYKIIRRKRLEKDLDIEAAGIDFRRVEIIGGIGYIDVCVFSFGINRVLGGCTYKYKIEKNGESWVPTMLEAFDP